MWEIIPIDFFILIVVVGICFLIFKKLKNSKTISKVVDGVIEPDVVSEYDNVVATAETQLKETEKQEENLKKKKVKISSKFNK